MLKNYLLVTLRSLRRQKLYAVLNVFGLAIGLAFCVLVLLFVHDELTFDRGHANADRIYRLYRDPVRADAPIDRELSMPVPAGPAMAATFPEVEAFVRIDRAGPGLTLRYGGALYEQPGVLFTDPAFFDIFTAPLRAGDPAVALADPQSIVLTPAVAQRLFGDEDPLGKTISVRMDDGYVDVRVTGLAEPPPPNTSLPFQALVPYELFVQHTSFMRRIVDRWDATRSITYVLLRSGADVAHVQAQMPRFMETHLGSMFDEMRTNGTWQGDGPPALYRLQPLLDIHLNPDVPEGITPPSDPRYAYLLSGIALAVLLIACINFMILAVGRSARRAKEVGVRKAMGAQRGQLMAQFWGEALLLSALALGLGLALAQAALPVFNELAGKALHLGSGASGLAALAVAGLVVVTGLVAGSYPALVLARVQPTVTLRDRAAVGGAGALTRGLVVVQFGLSVVLIVATLVMARQLDHLKTARLGFAGEQVVVIPTRGLDGQQVLARYRALAEARPDVIGVTGANIAPGLSLWRRGFAYEGEIKQVATFRVEPNFLETLGMDLVAGRAFDPTRGTDSTAAILINEAFARDFGWEEPVGRRLPVTWGTLREPEVIGVVRDFHFQSLHQAVAPAVLYVNASDPVLNVYARIRPDDVAGTLATLEATWKSLTPDVPFAHHFLDDAMDRLYASEERWGRIVGYGALFAILVACLGLLGMATLAAQRRTKEIGIRKVLGASVPGLVGLLVKEFVGLAGLAVVLAVPVGYVVMQRWLEGFASRVALGPGTFLLAGALVLAIALLTVSVQTLRAASANPVESLRYE